MLGRWHGMNGQGFAIDLKLTSRSSRPLAALACSMDWLVFKPHQPNLGYVVPLGTGANLSNRPL